MPRILRFGHRKGTIHTLISFKKKGIRDPPLVTDRSPSVAPVSSLRGKRFRGFRSKERGTRVKDRAKNGARRRCECEGGLRKGV